MSHVFSPLFSPLCFPSLPSPRCASLRFSVGFSALPFSLALCLLISYFSVSCPFRSLYVLPPCISVLSSAQGFFFYVWVASGPSLGRLYVVRSCFFLLQPSRYFVFPPALLFRDAYCVSLPCLLAYSSCALVCSEARSAVSVVCGCSPVSGPSFSVFGLLCIPFLCRFLLVLCVSRPSSLSCASARWIVGVISLFVPRRSSCSSSLCS